MKKVAVCMSTYNGEKYIKEQLDSLFSQEGVKVKLLIRDDGSTDSTLSIIESYPPQFCDILIIKDKNIGCENSYNQLCFYALKNIEADYYAFCDQDDFWLPSKLQEAVKVLDNYDNNMPNLYFSNLTLVDEELNIIRLLFDSKKKLNVKKQALIQNFAYGCTCVFNRKALKYYCQYPNNIIYHDYWIVAVCALFGNIFYDPNSYILYRQHSNNASGVKQRGFGLLFLRLKRLLTGLTGHTYENIAQQISESFEEYTATTEANTIKLLCNYRSNLIYKLKLLFSKKYKTGDFMKDCCIKIRILCNHI